MEFAVIQPGKLFQSSITTTAITTTLITIIMGGRRFKL